MSEREPEFPKVERVGGKLRISPWRSGGYGYLPRSDALLLHTRLGATLGLRAYADAREAVCAWAIRNSFATGHGDTLEDVLAELDWQISELRGKSRTYADGMRDATKIAQEQGARWYHDGRDEPEDSFRVQGAHEASQDIAAAIRARAEKEG